MDDGMTVLSEYASWSRQAVVSIALAGNLWFFVIQHTGTQLARQEHSAVKQLLAALLSIVPLLLLIAAIIDGVQSNIDYSDRMRALGLAPIVPYQVASVLTVAAAAILVGIFLPMDLLFKRDAYLALERSRRREGARSVAVLKAPPDGARAGRRA